MKLFYLVFSFFFISISSINAQSGMLQGKVVDEKNNPIANAVVQLFESDLVVGTDVNGNFSLSNVYKKNQKILVSAAGYLDLESSLEVNETNTVLIILKADALNTHQTFEERVSNTVTDENSSSEEDQVIQNVSGVLNSAMDPFVRMASFNFGPMHYNIRGYKGDQNSVLINNIMMNDIESGNVIWGQWGGLNDVFRSKTSTTGLNPGEYAFGGLYGSSIIDASASSQRKQMRVSYSSTNRTYRNRLMATYNTGVLTNGWAFSVSGSKRWSEEGYIPGTSYNGYSYFLAADKQLNEKSKLGIITFGTPTSSGKTAPVVGELYEIAGKYYNPNWGIQEGKIRNSKMRLSNTSTTVINFKHQYNSNKYLNIALGFQSGINSNSAMDWYNAPDPRPDYYRYLPSYQTDSNLRAVVANNWLQNPEVSQINWTKIYNTNYQSYDSVLDQNGHVIKRGIWSKYYQGAFVEKKKRLSLNINLMSALSENISMYSGIMLQKQNTENYKELLDLLGGEFAVNINQFAQRTFASNYDVAQFDLNNPSKILKVGDRYNYNYISIFNNVNLWNQWVMKYAKIDGFFATQVDYTTYQREGLFKNGLWQNNSFGNSARTDFFTINMKGGLTYKFNGRHFVFLNSTYRQDPPTFENYFISPQANNYTIDGDLIQISKSLETGYIYRAPNLKVNLTGFVTDVENTTDIIRFFNDDENAFVNYVMKGINNRSLGLEFGAEANLNSFWTVSLAAGLMQSFYTNNPTVMVYNQNDTSNTPLVKSKDKTVYWNNYYTGTGPQTALGLGLKYNAKKYWFATINVNYLDRNFVTISPERHTSAAVDGLALSSPERAFILNQEKLTSAFTVDLFGGKSFIVHKDANGHRTMCNITLGVNNVLNNQNILTGGFEQLRINQENLEAFGNKYFRAFGLNYFLNLAISY